MKILFGDLLTFSPAQAAKQKQLYHCKKLSVEVCLVRKLELRIQKYFDPINCEVFMGVSFKKDTVWLMGGVPSS